MFDTLAYRAFTARKLANLTASKKDARAASMCENELLNTLARNGQAGQIPTPKTQASNAQYASWATELAASA